MSEGQPDPADRHGQWELKLTRSIAARFRTTERDELEADLALHLLHVRRHRARAKHWKAYLTAALRNKASNWIRDRKRHERAHADLDAPVDDEQLLTRGDRIVAPDAPEDLRAAFAALWNELDPELRDIWEVLLQEGGNQVDAARRLKMHRNTLRLWVRKIQKAVIRHGFGDRR